MFKTMDGVEVYTKQDVDTLVEPIRQNAAEAKAETETLATRKLDKSEANLEFSADRTRLTELESGKADKTYVDGKFSEDRARLTALESGKADKSEVPTMFNDTMNSIISSKIQLITSDINHIVDQEIAHELQGYDDSTAVNQKIADAIASIPNPGVASTAEINEIVNQHF